MKKHILHLLLLAIVSIAFAQGNQNALHFDGSNDYDQTGYTGISCNTSRTVEAWIYTTVNSDPSTLAAQHPRRIDERRQRSNLNFYICIH